MDRRNFLKTVGTGAVALTLPAASRPSAGPLSSEQIETRVKELLSRMTLDEKIKQMSGEVLGNVVHMAVGYGKYNTVNTPANRRLGIPGIRFIDGPRGVNLKGSTCFPVSMARGATWDPKLEARVGEAMGYEARARGANFYGGVCINLVRHPSWGRSQETFGEDPLLLGRMGSAMLTGLQHHVMACTKHFAANSIDRSRHFVNVTMAERTLREIYLPHFKMCVDAGTAAVMSAYNNLNGYLCGHNRHLLREILKDDWKFQGMVISDFGLGVKDTVAAATAGLDVEMPSTMHYGPKLKQAVRAGKVPEAAIDEAVTRILRQKLRFSHLEDRAGYERNMIAGTEHAALAREVAAKGMVLLKNQGSLLPLSRKEIKTLAVIGELADTANIGDHGSSTVRPPYVITPLAGIKAKAEGLQIIFDSGENLASAQKAAKEADAAVVVVGCTDKNEGEGYDRLRLNLSEHHEQLLQAVAEANPRCVAVVEAGGAVIMENWKDRVPAILLAWYPGMEGGTALAQILFGEVNPSGKLPLTFPRSPDQLPFFDNTAKEIEYGYYHGYRLADQKGFEPAFPFGFGLSYTRYQYSNLRLDRKAIGKDGSVKVQVDVTNAGPVAGEETVQLYVGYRGSQVDRPVKDLKAFSRVALEPGQTQTLSLELKAKDLAYYNEQTGSWQIEEIQYPVFVGPASRAQDFLSDAFLVKGA